MRQKTTPREDVANRKTTPLERVKPLALGDLAESGVERIEVECEWCRHAAQVEIAPLIAREGPAALFRDIVRRLRCSVCGWNHVEAWPIRPGRERQRRRPSPLPSLKECREALAAVQFQPGAPAHERHATQMRALMDRWPDLGASQALFIVRAIGHERGGE